MKKITTPAIALLLGLAAPFALTGAALADVIVTFSDGTTTTVGDDEALELCESEIIDGTCTVDSMTLDEYLDSLEETNSAKAFAPGQRAKTEGGSAKDYAPGQVSKQDDGGSAKDNAPGQQKKN